MKCKDTTYIKLDKDIQVGEGEAGIIISSGIFVLIDGNGHTMFKDTNCSNTAQTIGILVQSPNTTVKVINLHMINLDTAIALNTGNSIIVDRNLVLGSTSFMTGAKVRSVNVNNSLIYETTEIFSGHSYDSVTIEETEIKNLMKLVSASAIDELLVHDSKILFATNSQGLFSSDQNIKKYSFINNSIMGEIANNSSLLSSSLTSSSMGIFNSNQFFFNSFKSSIRGTKFINFPAISAPIFRSFVFQDNIVEADFDYFFMVAGNSDPEGVDSILVLDSVFIINRNNTIASVTNFNPPTHGESEIKNHFTFDGNRVKGNVGSNNNEIGISVSNSRGVTITRSSLISFKLGIAVDQNNINSETDLNSKVYISDNTLTDSTFPLANNSKNVLGRNNTLPFNSQAPIGEPISSPAIIPE